jgi:cysteinyl-tRNA synthetase
MDLKFPHHENEVAQSRACLHHGLANVWMHNGMLNIDGEKMSKSLGNSFLPLELITGNHPLLDKGYSPMTVRFFFLQAQYRSTVDFSNEALQASEKGLKRLLSSIILLEEIKSSEKSSFNVKEIIDKCEKSMNDDFNTPITIAHLFDGIKFINLLKEEKETLTEDDLMVLKNHLIKSHYFDIESLLRLM